MAADEGEESQLETEGGAEGEIEGEIEGEAGAPPSPPDVPGGAGGEPEGEGGASPTPLLNRARELSPDDPTLARFKTDEAFLKSYREQRSLIGRTNEEAQAFRQLRERLGDEGLRQALQERAAAQDQKPGGDNGAAWPNLEQYLLWQKESDDGDVSAKSNLERVNKQLAREQLRLAEAAPKLLELLEKANSPTPAPEAYAAQVQQALACEQWRQTHHPELFVGGKAETGEFTALGEKFKEEYETLIQDGMPDGPRCWDRAFRSAKVGMPKPAGTRKAGQGAGRQAQPARNAAGDVDVDKLTDQLLDKYNNNVALVEAELDRLGL